MRIARFPRKLTIDCNRESSILAGKKVLSQNYLSQKHAIEKDSDMSGLVAGSGLLPEYVNRLGIAIYTISA
jgi:hypothetical protein